MRRYSTDPNSPDNPGSPSYVPTHFYELHVRPGSEPVYKPMQTKEEYSFKPQPNMGYAEMEVNLSQPITTLPTSMKFNGAAKSRNLMTQPFFFANQQNMGFGFQADIKKWLQQFQFIAMIDQADPNLSIAKITGASNDDFSSIETSASIREVDADSTTDLGNNVHLKSSATLDRSGSLDVTSSNSINGNISSVNWSSTKPTTITFSFTSKSIHGKAGNTDFEGVLSAKLQITVYPLVELPEEGEHQKSQTHTTNQTNTLLVSIAAGSAITAAILTFPNLLKWVAQVNPAYYSITHIK